MKDCSTCEHRAEINPQYKDMDWDELPCSHCQVPDTAYDKPTARDVLMSTDLIDRLPLHSFPVKPLRDARKADLLGKLLERALADPKDAAIIRHMMRYPDATHAETAKATGIPIATVRWRIARFSR